MLAAAPADDAVTALRDDPVFVDPDAEAALPAGDTADLRRRVGEAGTPIFVAVLPGSAGEPRSVLQEVREELGADGTYVVVVGDELWAASNRIRTADELAGDAVQTHASEGLEVILDELVGDLAVAASEGGGAGGAPALPPSRSPGAADEDGAEPGTSPVVLVLLAVAVLGGLAWLTVRRRRREETRRREALQAREDLRPSLTVLADDVLALEPAVAIHEEARPDYEEAVRRYRWAEAAIGQVDTAAEAGRVQRVLDEGHYAMARARAVTQGREPPPPPPELSMPGPNREPPVVVADDGVPTYAGYGGGWYGGGGWFGGDLLTGLAIGSILSGPGWGWGGGWGAGYGYGGYGDGGGGGDGGDMGGGDWGDVGGGDFGDFGDMGGGDFGGDFGGGDF